ncbi:hypothetical protein BCL57_002142 [Agromyces flavus]|uniref:Uncharacterized protein n=1 Tax=Agromyces flavus TaxID=589382 RepID=A0A1H1P5Z1_9MICO|nr:hypothetical protein [Agromyces flavus]MCP2367983.1 hypothetical protein [Agromyces flavus]GGI47445.1 hypothetical protein GCM10010932_21330 [Agromyces flavus]SDS06708.1 hypothetical protein SAMN04489721_0718 [Agromyces flavus]
MARRNPDSDGVLANPFAGRRGFFNRLNRFVYTFTGPAQVGIGRPEAPYEPPADPRCPICGAPMAEHRVDRSGERTQLYCPAPAGVGAGAGA